MSFYIKIGDHRQILYYADRPIYSFSVGTGVDKSWRKNPVWSPITIEVPTRPIREFELWIKNPVKIDMNLLLVHDSGKRVLEDHFLEGVTMSHFCEKRAIYASVNVYSIILVYKHAMMRDHT